MNSDTIRWGILGTGKIAEAFAAGLGFLPDASLMAVGSRTAISAERFGNRFNLPRRYESYAALADDPDIDVIYVATPHVFHKDNTILCLEAGKHVLCEKPFAINAREASAVIATARRQQRFVMEALWTRFIPAVKEAQAILAAGTIGELRLLLADFGFCAEYDPQSRLFAPELGGGALLDIGIYPLSQAILFMGLPERIVSHAVLGETGVDEQEVIVLDYGNGALASLTATCRAETAKEVTLVGSKGRLRLHGPIYRPAKLTLTRNGKQDKIIDVPYEGNGYNYEAAEVMGCIRASRFESETMPWDETLALMKIMDQIRAQWGLKYPTE